MPAALWLGKSRFSVEKLDVPVPILSAKDASVRALTSILAEECISLLVPSCQEVPAADILEVRDALSDLLVPFRISLQGLSKDLRDAIDSDESTYNIHKEAQFIVESKVEPALFELRQKIELSDSKLFNKVFGKVLSWIPFVAKAFAVPTPDNILSVAKKVGTDTNAILDGVDDASFTRTQGLCFLLKAEKTLTGKKK